MTTAQPARLGVGRNTNVGEYSPAPVGEAEAPSQLNVVLALRNHVERLGIKQMLQSSDIVDLCQSHEDLSGAVKEAVLYKSAVLIVALQEIDQSAGALLRTVTRHDVKVLVLVDDLTYLSRLAGIRSSGLVSIRDVSARSLHIALQRLRGGEMPIPPQVAHFLLSVASEEHDAGTTRIRVRMTPREQEVLVLLVDGLSNKQIARRLAISEHGAKRHVANVLAKLDCSNRTLAVSKALREGLYEEYLQLT
jgi:two-component system nitrate/nitrite response regulator NarL